MSQENLEIMRRVIDAINRMDFDVALRDVAPDAVIDFSHSRGPEAGIFAGHEAIRRFWGDLGEAFERHELIPSDLISHGEHVVIPITSRMRGRGGIELEAKTATVANFRDGRLVRWTMYQDKAEALVAVGLEE
jgi:ketosteroid isomerase-like protein